MRTFVQLERLRSDGSLAERRCQLSRSYTYDFIKVLYTRFSQAAFEVPLHAHLLQTCSSFGEWYGILIGTGTAGLSVHDSVLDSYIGHGTASTGPVSKFTNPGFETGDFTGWTASGFSVVPTTTHHFLGSSGNYCARAPGSGWIQQSVDLTNATAIAFGLHYSGVGLSPVCSVSVGATTIYSRTTFYDGWIYLPISGYSGTHAVRVSFTAMSPNHVDNFTLFSSQMLWGDTEVFPPTFTASTGDLVMRRTFQNLSGSPITVNEVGLLALPRLVARDRIIPGITVSHTETLRVSYIMRITL